MTRNIIYQYNIKHIIYSGLNQTNVISIQLFTIAEEFKTRSIDLISSAFSHFPKAEWAIISFSRQVRVNISYKIRVEVFFTLKFVRNFKI